MKGAFFFFFFNLSSLNTQGYISLCRVRVPNSVVSLAVTQDEGQTQRMSSRRALLTKSVLFMALTSLMCIRNAISLAYEACCFTVPLGFRAYCTRGVATLQALSKGEPLEGNCVAAKLASAHFV